MNFVDVPVDDMEGWDDPESIYGTGEVCGAEAGERDKGPREDFVEYMSEDVKKMLGTETDGE